MAQNVKSPSPSLLDDLVAANRILYAQKIVDGLGHVSVRHDKNPDMYVLAAERAPGLVTRRDLAIYDLDSNAVTLRDRRPYNERFIHGEIYKARPDVNAVVHNHSPTVVPFSCTGCELKPIFHMAAFIGLGVPGWDIRDAQKGTDLLVRTPYLGEHLARTLGKHPAVLMRGHGSTVVAENLQRAVGRTIYLEMNARMQLQATLLAGAGGRIVFLDEAEVAANVAWQNYVRSWELWKRKALARLAAEKQAGA